MGLIELPTAIANAFVTIGEFFSKVYWFFFGIAFGIGFVFWVLIFFGLQLVFIYVYFRMILFALSMRPRIQQLMNTIEHMFD